ncbi:glycosyltransferase family 4 protein [Roseateles sp. DB2]|uniref:glycosyltransferase family 4 protein n=1 Tax=Roseateles sp. DB2 TaxID=3453717 RepID=UPI003EEE6315
MKLVLIGDGESPHLLKWGRALAAVSGLQLYAASSRGFTEAFEAIVPAERRLVLGTDPRHGGGNVAVLKTLPRLGRWLAEVDADWLHPHYLTSHGTLAWAAKTGWRLRAKIAGSAWGSDILVTPQQGWAYRWLTSRVLRACTLCTSDSLHMSERMRALGAGEVMTFPFGLEALPRQNVRKSPWLFYSNRGLEPIYRPDRVLATFAAIAALRPEARLVMANDGSLRARLEAQAQASGLGERIDWVGRLDPKAQGAHYARARWFLSLPASDSVSVSVLEAMAHECLPLLSELPANRELLADGQRGLVLAEDAQADGRALVDQLEALLAQGESVGTVNREWVASHALFPPAVRRFVERLRALDAAPSKAD